MLGLNSGLLLPWHWQSGALATWLDLIHKLSVYINFISFLSSSEDEFGSVSPIYVFGAPGSVGCSGDFFGVTGLGGIIQ